MIAPMVAAAAVILVAVLASCAPAPLPPAAQAGVGGITMEAGFSAFCAGHPGVATCP